jgi:hypothetical protein
VNDNRQLLLKYIDHVGAAEGTTFLSGYYQNEGQFTESEWAELLVLNEESWEAALRRIRSSR